MSQPQNDDFASMVAADFSDEEITENPTTTPPEESPKQDDPATPPASDDNAEEPKKDDPADPKDPNKKDEEQEDPAADPAKPTDEDPAKPQDPATPPEEEEQPKPLTEEGVLRLLQQARTEEQDTAKEYQNAYRDVMSAYYPDGLSEVLVDQNTGKELRTPQDVVDATDGALTMEQATQWLMNKEYELKQSIEGIKRQASELAETTVNFKRDAISAVQKYEPLFTQYPQLQEKVFNLMMQQVQADTEKGVIIKAPDVMDLYDTYLEPYQKAFEFSTSQSATNPTAPVTPPPAPKPTQDDRLDEGAGGNGGVTPVNDPTDFAQQVTKELAGEF